MTAVGPLSVIWFAQNPRLGHKCSDLPIETNSGKTLTGGSWYALIYLAYRPIELDFRRRSVLPTGRQRQPHWFHSKLSRRLAFWSPGGGSVTPAGARGLKLPGLRRARRLDLDELPAEASLD